jgi:hypothetical protein
VSGERGRGRGERGERGEGGGEGGERRWRDAMDTVVKFVVGRGEGMRGVGLAYLVAF